MNELPEAAALAVAEYDRLRAQFETDRGSYDWPRLDRFLWYHAVELPGGIVTPGHFDLRSSTEPLSLPEDLTGQTVLDVGSATGFFAFEFERRGARVASVELPSMAEWDMPPGPDRELTLTELRRQHGVETNEELFECHLDGPFRFCHAALGSQVERYYSSIYNLRPEVVGDRTYDVVFLGDILVHLFSPLGALAAASTVCARRLVISQIVDDSPSSEPLLRYIGGGLRSGDSRSWWIPNRQCLADMLHRLGFASVDFLGGYTVIERPSGEVSYRTVVHATRP